MKVSTVDEMRSLDEAAMDRYGIKDELLMENAGEATYFVILTRFGIMDRRFVIFSGSGNNGGDGFVIARKIHSMGGSVKVYMLGDPAKYKGAAKLNLDILSRLPIETARVESVEQIRADVLHCNAVVDAVFGTGLMRDVQGLYAGVIDLINRSGKTVFSVDIPSGVHGDTGAVMGTAVQADVTVTYGLPKLGNCLYPGSALCGDLYVTHISFPPSMIQSVKTEINGPVPLSPRDPQGHKGTFGDALFIAGAAAYYGAPYFSALAFMKAGGGYARLAAPSFMTPFIANKGSEIVFMPQKETGSGSIASENKEALLDMARRVDMTILGPGLSLDPETAQLARDLVQLIEKPLLLDGDGITALCEDLDVIRGRKAETILTPHPGEMARVTAKGVTEIAADPVGVLTETCKDLNAFIVLKGAHSLIGYPDERVYINMSGNSGMATAGSGDVLTGAIGAMYGLGCPVPEAVRMGVFVHGLAGDLAAEDLGEDGITAQDILAHLPPAMRTIRRGLDKASADRYLGMRIV